VLAAPPFDLVLVVILKHNKLILEDPEPKLYILMKIYVTLRQQSFQ
jgi:hypothetical protein